MRTFLIKLINRKDQKVARVLQKKSDCAYHALKTVHDAMDQGMRKEFYLSEAKNYEKM